MTCKDSNMTEPSKTDSVSCITCGSTVYVAATSVVDETIKAIFEVLTLPLETDKPIQRICNSCIEQLYYAFGFKSKCVETEDYLIPHLPLDNHEYKLDLLDLIMVKSEEGTYEGIDISKVQVCRLCKNFVSGSVFVSLLEFLKEENGNEIFQRFIPETRLNICRHPIICGPCQTSFKRFSSFVLLVSAYMESALNDTAQEAINPVVLDNTESTDQTSDNIYRCQLCSYSSRDKILLKRHKIIHGDKKYDCDRCLYSTKRRQCLKRHIERVHEKTSKVKRKLRKRSQDLPKKYHCDSCEFKTAQKSHLQLHTVKHKKDTEIQKFICFHCSLETRHKRALIAHMNTHKRDGEVKMNKCTECSYQSRYSLAKHMRTHKKETFSCDSCSYTVSNKVIFQQHIRIKHLGIDTRTFHKCKLCPYTSPSPSHVKRHMMVHEKTNSKLYKCVQCTYQTNFNENLKKHILTHKAKDEVELFKCSLCEFQTKHKSYMKMHMTTHGGDNVKEKKCPFCSYKSQFSGNITYHITRYHKPEDQTKYMCQQCDFVTVLKGSLTTHIRVVHGTDECEYKCNKCWYQTKVKASIKRHMRSMHSDDEFEDVKK